MGCVQGASLWQTSITPTLMYPSYESLTGQILFHVVLNQVMSLMQPNPVYIYATATASATPPPVRTQHHSQCVWLWIALVLYAQILHVFDFCCHSDILEVNGISLVLHKAIKTRAETPSQIIMISSLYIFFRVDIFTVNQHAYMYQMDSLIIHRETVINVLFCLVIFYYYH